MTYNAKYNESAYKYRKEAFKRIPLDVTKEKYAEIKTAADETGESVNGFIKKAIDTRLQSIKNL